MPIVEGIGYGNLTELKILHFSKIIEYHLLITQAVLKKNQRYYPQKYNYYDLTAGCGSTPNGLKGCAITFIEQAENERIDIACEANFIDCDQNHIDALKQHLVKQKHISGWKKTVWNFHVGRYQDVIPMLLTKKTSEFGLAFIDHSGDLPDFETIKFISKIRPKMDVLIYLPATNIKRTYQYTEKRLTDYLASIPKNSWMIRQPVKWDRHKWTFLLGTNATKNLFKDYKNIGFYRIESDLGNKYLKQLNLTTKEQNEELQPSLF